VAGIVPPFWNDPKPEYVAKNARETVAKEIEAARPPLILDSPSALGSFSIKRVPDLAQILERDYCSIGSATGNSGRPTDLYLRKDRPECADRR
jgi:hypothetical protein